MKKTPPYFVITNLTRLVTQSSLFLLLLFFQPASSASVQSELKNLFATDAPKNSKWGVLVVNAATQKPVFEIAPDDGLIPASNMKIVTCAAALLKLGPSFVYETKILRNGSVQGTELRGNLVIQGSGDPVIGGRFNGGKITATFKEWATRLKQNNIQVISGDLIGDDSAFDDERTGLNWHPDDQDEWYAAEVSALSLNDACIDVYIEASRQLNQAATVRFDPPTKYLSLNNMIRTVSGKNQVRGINVGRDIDTRTLNISAALLPGHHQLEYVPVPDPTLFFLTVLKETLESEGIQVLGSVRRAEEKDLRLKNPDWIELFAHQSPPLTDIIGVCLRNSQNLYAEHLLKTLGFHEYGLGSLKNGAAAIKDVFYQNGCVIDNQFIADGSGLSRDNYFNAHSFVDILQVMNGSPYSSEFRNALAVSGVTGTLKNRMRGTAAHNRVYAKTGTLNGVRALSGYIEAKSGELYIFSMLANGRSQASRFSSLMDSVCEIVSERG